MLEKQIDELTQMHISDLDKIQVLRLLTSAYDEGTHIHDKELDLLTQNIREIQELLK